MERKEKGVAPAFVAVIVIIIMAVAAVGAYVALSKPNPSTSSASSSAPSSTTILSSDMTTTTASSTASTMTTNQTTSLESSSSSSRSNTTTGTSESSSCDTSSGPGYPFNMAPLLSSYSGMVVRYNGTSQTSGSTQSAIDVQDQYSLEYTSATTYKLVDNLQVFENGTSQRYTSQVYVLKNGTVAAITVTQGGQNVNLTGSEFSEGVAGAFGPFVFQAQLVDNLGGYGETYFFHSNGASTVTIGANTFTGTSYIANSIPETITDCDGSSTTYTAFSLIEGTPTGATLPLAIDVQFAGSFAVGGVTTTSNIDVQVTAVTVAS
jgi:cytoskeletal protein RodZ